MKVQFYKLIGENETGKNAYIVAENSITGKKCIMVVDDENNVAIMEDE